MFRFVDRIYILLIFKYHIAIAIMPKKQKVAENLKILQEEFQDSSDEEVEAALGQMVSINNF